MCIRDRPLRGGYRPPDAPEKRLRRAGGAFCAPEALFGGVRGSGSPPGEAARAGGASRQCP
eukprot:5845719-Alexandrium_andersonii.AAC.1